MQIYNIRFCI